VKPKKKYKKRCCEWCGGRLLAKWPFCSIECALSNSAFEMGFKAGVEIERERVAHHKAQMAVGTGSLEAARATLQFGTMPSSSASEVQK
jgi:hypothetical protein